MLKTVSALTAMAAASVLVLPTNSQAEESNSVRVSYADLNLGSDVGQQLFQRRLADAARTVCVMEDSRELALASATKACRSDALARARPAYEMALAAARHGMITVGEGAALTVTAH